MTNTPKPKEVEKPWRQYRREPQHRLLEPGWGGSLDDEEVAYILDRLKADDQLSYWWGFRPRARRRAIEAICKVSQSGDPENRSHNMALVRKAGRGPKADIESAPSRVKNAGNPSPPRMGRKKVEGWESEMLRLASTGVGVHKIAKALKAQYGIAISGPTVAARLRELKGQLRLIS